MDMLLKNGITIDGAEGEGGGQILRTALTLSLVTGTPFRIERIRSGRSTPGLLRQHLTAVHAAAAVGGARVEGAELGSQTLTFVPSGIRSGAYEFAVGTAGSATLIVQTVLPALLAADAPSRIIVEGGTHNPLAPPFEFLSMTFLSLLGRMGAVVHGTLDRPGFYPAGGGRMTFDIRPCTALRPLTLLQRGTTTVHARSLSAFLPSSVASRELRIVCERLSIDRDRCRMDSMATSIGPGNVLLITLTSDAVTEIVSGFGVKGVSAEKVASEACDEAERYLATDVPVGQYLADQLLIPMALAGAGAFRTLTPSRHTRTNAAIIRRFLDVPIEISPESSDSALIRIGAPSVDGSESEDR
jgi:RNA 3'-terminal phosphate cyclase (ATP)